MVEYSHFLVCQPSLAKRRFFSVRVTSIVSGAKLPETKPIYLFAS